MPLGYNHKEDPTNRIRGQKGRPWQSFLAMGPARSGQTRVSPPMPMFDAVRRVDSAGEIQDQMEAVNGANALGSQGGTPRTRFTPRLGTLPGVPPIGNNVNPRGPTEGYRNEAGNR